MPPLPAHSRRRAAPRFRRETSENRRSAPWRARLPGKTRSARRPRVPQPLPANGSGYAARARREAPRPEKRTRRQTRSRAPRPVDLSRSGSAGRLSTARQRLPARSGPPAADEPPLRPTAPGNGRGRPSRARRHGSRPAIRRAASHRTLRRRCRRDRANRCRARCRDRRCGRSADPSP